MVIIVWLCFIASAGDVHWEILKEEHFSITFIQTSFFLICSRAQGFSLRIIRKQFSGVSCLVRSRLSYTRKSPASEKRWLDKPVFSAAPRPGVEILLTCGNFQSWENESAYLGGIFWTSTYTFAYRARLTEAFFFFFKMYLFILERENARARRREEQRERESSTDSMSARSLTRGLTSGPWDQDPCWNLELDA